MNTMVRTLLGLCACASFGALPLSAQEHQHAHGSHAPVEFPVSCDPTVQQDFNQAVALLHSFQYEDARRAFTAIAERDPACGMAWWGVAMSWFHILWAAPTPDELAAGRAAAERATHLGAGTERERAYIAAISAFYADADRLDHRTRAAAYRDAMERTATTFQDDHEASIFHALSILGAAPPSDTTYRSQKRAAAILDRLLEVHPGHPGIAHYTIHAFDYPALAELALPAARVYASLAPGSPHALHMPTHIFTRLGLWDESIASNEACRETADAAVARTHPGASAFEALHCQDYLVYAWLQKGEDERALQVLERVSKATRFDDGNFGAGYAMLAVPARYALERRDWKAAAALLHSNAKLPWELFSYARGITWFANAVGAARSGEVARSRAAVAELERLQESLAAEPPAVPYDWAGQVESMRLAAAGWLAHAEGGAEEAVRLLTKAAEKEELVGKHPVTPGAILPAREQLGDLLLELDRPAEALAAYEAGLADAPRRFNSVAGAARAARAAGERGKAAEYYRALLDLAGSSTTRPEPLGEARAFLATASTGAR